jgi:hypothetical protein
MRERVAVSDGASLPQTARVRDVMIMPPAKKYMYIFKNFNQQERYFFALIYYTF